MRLTWNSCWLCLLMLASHPAGAQEVPVAGTARFGQLQVSLSGQRLILHHADGRRQEVRDARLDPDGRVRSGGDSTGVPLADLRSIEARGSASGKAALVGALLGTAVFLGAGLSMANDPLFSDTGGGAVAVISAFGAGIGALTGALIGAPFHHWKTVYRGPSGPRPTFGREGGVFRIGARLTF